jgi:hypothetical protein
VIVATVVWVDGHEITVTPHAFERYRERVSRFDELEPASDELLRLVAFGGTVGSRPRWQSEGPNAAETYLMVGQNIGLPLRGGGRRWRAVTCVSLGWVRRTRETARAARAATGIDEGGKAA